MTTTQEVEGKLSRYKRAEIHEFLMKVLDTVRANHETGCFFTLFEHQLLDILIKSDFCLDNRSDREEIITALECHLLANEKRLTWDDLLTEAEQRVHAMCLQLNGYIDALDPQQRMELNNRITNVELKEQRQVLNIFLQDIVNMFLKFSGHHQLIPAEQKVMEFLGGETTRQEAINKVANFNVLIRNAYLNNTPLIPDECAWHQFCRNNFDLIHGAVN